MPRYRANARFGPWSPGEEFESEDDFHAAMAENSGLLTEVGGGRPPRPGVGPSPRLQASLFDDADAPSPGRPTLGGEESP